MKIVLFWTLIIMCELADFSEKMMQNSSGNQVEIKNTKLVIPNVYDFFPENNSLITPVSLVD